MCAQPYIMMNSDGRMVGQRTTYEDNTSVSKAPRFPQQAELLVNGLCGLDILERKALTSEMEALKEERFFASEWYVTSQSFLVKSQTSRE